MSFRGQSRNATTGRMPLYNDQTAQRRHRPDYWLLLIAALLLTIGLVVVYAISPGLAAHQNVSEQYYVSKQLIAISLGVVAFVISSLLPLRFWKRYYKGLAIAAAVAAIVVLFFGQEVYGATRWIQIGGISFQSVELVKFAFIMWLGIFLSERMKTGQVASVDRTLKPLAIVLGAMALVIAVFQSDLGSTGVIFAIALVMTFLAGLPFRIIGYGLCIVALLTLGLVATSSYRRDRFTTFLHPDRDCLTTGYQACQALIAIGSGGMTGKGLSRSVQAYGYLPEAANDSIFAISAEIFGYVGIVVILGLFVALFARLKRIIERLDDEYTRLIVAGVLAWLSTQAIINIGAMIGLLPLKGITLPLVSYGGTSLLFVMAALGVAYQASRYTSHAPVRLGNKQGERSAIPVHRTNDVTRSGL